MAKRHMYDLHKTPTPTPTPKQLLLSIPLPFHTCTYMIVPGNCL